MIIKKSLLKKAMIFLGGLMLLGMLVLVAGPIVFVDAAEVNCGDGVCDFNSENNDLCPEDCHCNDNGEVDPGEGCGCKDMICEGEEVASACGTPVGADGECPGNLVDSGGVCWDRCECQGICSEDDEQKAQPAVGPAPPGCPDYSGGGWVNTNVPVTEPNPCAGGMQNGTWWCRGTGEVSSPALCCAGSGVPTNQGVICD